MATETLKNQISESIHEVFEKRLGIKKHTLERKKQTKELVDGNIFKLGHVLLDLHEKFGIVPDYKPLSEFERFSTIGDIERYFLEKQ